MKRIIVLVVLLAALTFGAGYRYTRPPRTPADPIVYTTTCLEHSAWSADAPTRWKAQMYGRQHLRTVTHRKYRGRLAIVVTRHN